MEELENFEVMSEQCGAGESGLSKLQTYFINNLLQYTYFCESPLEFLHSYS